MLKTCPNSGKLQLCSRKKHLTLCSETCPCLPKIRLATAIPPLIASVSQFTIPHVCPITLNYRSQAGGNWHNNNILSPPFYGHPTWATNQQLWMPGTTFWYPYTGYMWRDMGSWEYQALLGNWDLGGTSDQINGFPGDTLRIVNSFDISILSTIRIPDEVREYWYSTPCCCPSHDPYCREQVVEYHNRAESFRARPPLGHPMQLGGEPWNYETVVGSGKLRTGRITVNIEINVQLSQSEWENLTANELQQMVNTHLMSARIDVQLAESFGGDDYDKAENIHHIYELLPLSGGISSGAGYIWFPNADYLHTWSNSGYSSDSRCLNYGQENSGEMMTEASRGFISFGDLTWREKSSSLDSVQNPRESSVVPPPTRQIERRSSVIVPDMEFIVRNRPSTCKACEEFTGAHCEMQFPNSICTSGWQSWLRNQYSKCPKGEW